MNTGQCGGMVDAIDSKSITRTGVEVRVLSLAQLKKSFGAFLIVPEKYDNCLSYGRTRKAQACL